MKRKVSKMGVLSVIMIIISIIAGINLYMKMSPKMMDLYEYYNLDKNNANQIAIALEDKICKDEKAIVATNEKYVDLNVMCDDVSSQFFWDAQGKILIVTTPNAILACGVGTQSYKLNNEEQNFDKVIVLEQNGKKYISLSFVQKVCNVECVAYENPNRIVLSYSFGQNEKKVKVASVGDIRYQASDKSNILKKVKKDEVLRVVKEKEYISPDFIKVMSEDGFLGYIRKKYVSDEYEEVHAMKEKTKVPEYTQVGVDGKVCLGWYNVTNQASNSAQVYNNYMANADSINVVAPTWLNVKSNDGSLESITSSELVQKFRSDGKKVWVVVQDFGSQDDKAFSISEIIKNTSTRIALVNNIINEVDNVSADGINIDFEYIKEEDGKFFIQFLRELKTKCSAKNLALSVDSYVPKFREQYNIGEQSRFVDYVVIMAYDKVVGARNEEERDSTSPIEWISEETIAGSFERGVLPNKLVVGLPFFSLDYISNEDGSNQTTEKKTISELTTLMKASNAQAEWDDMKKQNHVLLKDSKGMAHEFWIEDEKSMEQKLAVLAKNKVAGVGFWKLGQETKEIWGPITNYLNQ